MRKRTSVYVFRYLYFKLPIEARKLFKLELVRDNICTVKTFNNWLALGIPSGSAAVTQVKDLLHHYENIKIVDEITPKKPL